MAKVETVFTADPAQAERALAQLENKYAALENKLRQVSKKSREGAEDSAKGLDQWASKISTMAGSYLALGSLIHNAYQAQIQLNKASDEGVLKYDELIRRLRVQSGFTAVQGQDAQKRLTKIAIDTAVPFATAAGGAEELISQGFSAEEGSGSAAQRLLEAMQATNSDLGQVKEQAKAYAALLAAVGLDKTTENLEKVTRAVQRTFKGTPLQASDLVNLAPKLQGVSSAVPWEEALAQFTVMREKSSPDVASTALKIFWERLQTASGDTSAMEALGRMGLQPGMVDAIGESPQEVLDRLAAGLEKLKPEQRAVVMKDLFGQEAMAAATGLIRDREKVKDFVRLQDDEAGFQEDAAIRKKGSTAAKTRSDLVVEQQKMKEADFEEKLRAADILAREAGVPEATISIQHGSAYTRQFLGSDSTAAVAGAFIDPEQMKLPWWSRSGDSMPPELLEAKVAELRGQLPGGMSARQFLDATGDGLTGEERTLAVRTALEAVLESEGKNTVSAPAREQLAEQQLEATKEQTEALKRFLEEVKGKPKRSPSGAE